MKHFSGQPENFETSIFFQGNQKNFWQDFLVQLAEKIPEKKYQKFVKEQNLENCRNFLKTENLAQFPENFL